MQDKRKAGKQNQGFTDKPATNALQAQTTESIAVEKILREQDAQFSSLFKAAPVGIGLVIERVFTQVNPHFCEMLGYKEAELIGQSARMIYPNQTEFLRVGELKVQPN